MIIICYIVVSVPDPHTRERGSGDFGRFSWFFACILAYDYHGVVYTLNQLLHYIHLVV